MFLYRLQVEEEQRGIIHIIVLSSSDEKAFVAAEKQLERSSLVTPRVKEWLLLEKKRIHEGSGYVIDPNEIA